MRALPKGIRSDVRTCNRSPSICAFRTMCCSACSDPTRRTRSLARRRQRKTSERCAVHGARFHGARADASTALQGEAADFAVSASWRPPGDGESQLRLRITNRTEHRLALYRQTHTLHSLTLTQRPHTHNYGPLTRTAQAHPHTHTHTRMDGGRTQAHTDSHAHAQTRPKDTQTRKHQQGRRAMRKVEEGTLPRTVLSRTKRPG